MNLDEHLEQFRLRFLQDALSHAHAPNWLRRADAFEAARPRNGDYLGGAGQDALDARDDRLAARARACRSHARLMLGGDLG